MRSHPYVLLKGQFLGISSISCRNISENWGDFLLSTLSELLQRYKQWNNLERSFHAIGAGKQEADAIGAGLLASKKPIPSVPP